jgi:hypothetical protein
VEGGLLPSSLHLLDLDQEAVELGASRRCGDSADLLGGLALPPRPGACRTLVIVRRRRSNSTISYCGNSPRTMEPSVLRSHRRTACAGSSSHQAAAPGLGRKRERREPERALSQVVRSGRVRLGRGCARIHAWLSHKPPQTPVHRLVVGRHHVSGLLERPTMGHQPHVLVSCVDYSHHRPARRIWAFAQQPHAETEAGLGRESARPRASDRVSAGSCRRPVIRSA